tara:strand:+ start:251 stop:2554 length:2304 start_codon:yes stop_codon:yes gene_type:complete
LFSQSLIKDFVLDNEITDGYEVNSISISHDGSTISFSEKPILDTDNPYADCDLFNKVVFFNYENNQYIKKGNTIIATYQNCGDYSEPGFGDNISLSQTGNMVVINSEDHYSSTPINTFCEFSGTGTNLYVFKYVQNQWIQQKHLWDPENDGYSNCVYNYFSVPNTSEFCCDYDYYEVYINEKEYNQYDVKMKRTKDNYHNGFISFTNESLDYNGSYINGFVENGYTEIGNFDDRSYFVFDEDLDVMLKSNGDNFQSGIYVESGSKLTFLKLNNGVWEEHLSPIGLSTIPINPLIYGYSHPLNYNINDNLGSVMSIFDNGESVIITTGENNNVVFYLVWENNGWIIKQSFDNTTSSTEYNETVLGDLSSNGLWLTLKVKEPDYDSDFNRHYYYNYRMDPVTKEYVFQNKISGKDVGVDFYLFSSEVQISNNGKLLIKYRNSIDGDLLKVYNVNSNNNTQDSDGDGVYDDSDTCPNTPTGEAVDEIGCSVSQIDSDGDGVNDDVDACPDTPSGETVDENGCQIDNEINNFPWMNDLEGGNDGTTLNLYVGGTIGVNWYSSYGINESSCISFEIPDNYDYSSVLDGYQITPTFRVNDNSSDLFKVNVRSFNGDQISWFPVVSYENSLFDMLDPNGNQFGEITTNSQSFQEYSFDISYYENMNIQVGIYLTGSFSSSFYLFSDNWEIGNSTLNFTVSTNNNISVYPNPTNNILNIDFNDYKSSELFSMDGKSILKSTLKQIDFSNEVKGIYFLVIEDINGKKSKGIKVIKE